MGIDQSNTVDYVKQLVRSLKAVSNYRFTNTPIQRVQTTDFIKNSVLLHQTGNEIEIKLVTPAGEHTTLIVLDEPKEKGTITPFIDQYTSYSGTGNQVKYMVMVPDVLFQSETDINVVVPLLYKIIRSYVVQIDPFVTVEYSELSNRRFLTTYEIEMDLLVLYSIYDIIVDWFTCEENDRNNIIIDCLNSPEYMIKHGEVSINAQILSPLMESVSKIYKHIHHSESSESTAYYDIFHDGLFLSFL